MAKYSLVGGRLPDTARLRLALDVLSSWAAVVPHRELESRIDGEGEEAIGEAIQDLYCKLEETTWPLSGPGGERELRSYNERLELANRGIPELQRRIVAAGELPDGLLRRIFDLKPELAVQPALSGNSIVFEVDGEKLSEYQELADDIEFEEAKKARGAGDEVQWTWEKVDAEMRRRLTSDPEGFPALSIRNKATLIGCSPSLIRKVTKDKCSEFWSKVTQNTRHARKSLPAVGSLTDKVAESIGQHDEELTRLIAEHHVDFEDSPLVSTESLRGRVINRHR